MPTIQKIVMKNKGNKEYDCYLDDGKHFMLHEDVLVKMGLYKGQELSEEEVQDLDTESSLRKVTHQALSYLSYRMRSKAEMRAYLTKRDYSQSVVDKVMIRLEQQGYINDEDFATAFVRTKVNTTLVGPGKIMNDLIKKGIDAQVANKALEHFSKEQQLDQAKKLIFKRMSQKKRYSHKEHMQKIKQYLLQKGFSFDMIEEAFNEVEIEKDPNEERNALLKQAEKVEKKYRHLDSYQFQMKMKSYLYGKGFSISNIEDYLSHHSEE